MTSAEFVNDLIMVSTQLPEIEVRITIQNGHIALSIPKGPEGDRYEALLARYQGRLMKIEGASPH